jgi:hypothetical protein
MKQWSLDARSWRQTRPPLKELRKTIVKMRGPKKVLVLGVAHPWAKRLSWQTQGGRVK